MIHVLILLLSLLLSFEASAATLLWDAQTIVSPLTVEHSTTQTGPYAPVATLPGGTTSYILTPGAYGWYRVRNSAGPSNVVQFSLDLFTGPVTQRLDTLEAGSLQVTRDIALLTQQVVGLNSSVASEPWMAPIAALALRVQALEAGPVVTPPPPAPTSNLTIRHIDPDHIEITCNGIGISTTGSGTRRFMECRH